MVQREHYQEQILGIILVVDFKGGNMVEILESNRKPTFGQKLNAGVGRGLQVGNELMGQYQQKQMMQQENEAAKKLGINLEGIHDPKMRQEALSIALQGQYTKPLTSLQQSQKSLADERLKALQGKEKLFSKLFQGNPDQVKNNQNSNPKEQNSPQNEEQFDLSQLPQDNLSKLAAFAGQPGEEGIIGNMAQAELDKQNKEKEGRTAKEKEYFKINEPKVMELAENNRKLKQEGARYDRLEQLFSDPSKFPSSLTAALFTKDGQINDVVYSQMTPEAQEAVKLIIDSTSNIKDTYGARVTNFDLQTYLRKLPSLLNSPEGKSRVLRDLKIMNRLNQLHSSGIQEIFEEAGGTDKIPFSTAEKRYEKRYGGLEKDLMNQFITPDKGVFEKMPEPNKYLGRKIKNPETGEIFISDGKEWKPFKG